MRRVKTGQNVFDAAVDRVADVYRDGHTVVVSCSGGKDSAVCMEIALIAADMTGNLPVNACTQDEEIAYPGTHDYLERVVTRPDVDFKWFDCRQPMVNVFNRANPYFWVFDEQLKPEQWVRQPPPFAVRSQHIDIEHIVHPKWFSVEKGKHLVDVVGLRASESAKRLLGLVSSGSHLTKPRNRDGVPYQKLRPIYDWTDKDVWKAISDNKWDYNKAYDVMHRMGVRTREMRIGPPTINVMAADCLQMASKAWPKWFDRVCDRLEGVRQAAQFGSLVCKPRRRYNETWQECFYRTCIDEAPADWIRERSILLEEHVKSIHRRHSNEPIPDVRPCMDCGGALIGSYKKMANAAFSGDPFSLKLAAISSAKFPALEPEFFREGAGIWDGSPTF